MSTPTDDELNVLHPVRPRFGFQLDTNWRSDSSDEPCESCGQPAATLSPEGERLHPICHEIKQKATTQKGEQ